MYGLNHWCFIQQQETEVIVRLFARGRPLHNIVEESLYDADVPPAGQRNELLSQCASLVQFDQEHAFGMTGFLKRIFHQ